MRKSPKLLNHEFVEFIPDILESGTIYISIQYATAAHLCGCGCGLKVVTPINPRGWKLTFDGETISLYPSIGNQQFPCRSHYWIHESRIAWAGDMKQIKPVTITTNQKPAEKSLLGFLRWFRKKANVD